MAYVKLTPETALKKYKINVVGECLIWAGPISDFGYGYFTLNHRMYPVHRYFASQKYGELNKLDKVTHKCNNKLCVNLEHLIYQPYKAKYKTKK